MSDVARILDRVQPGEPQAAEDLLPLIYDELRRLAAIKMADQPIGHTLQPTALVHEAYLRLAGAQRKKWRNSRHFYAAAAQAMRHILIDIARKKGRMQHGGDWRRVDLEAVHLAVETAPDALLAVDEALADFEREDPDKAELVKLRFFCGLSLPQAAQTLDWSLATAKRAWAFSRAWLYQRLTNEK